MNIKTIAILLYFFILFTPAVYADSYWSSLDYAENGSVLDVYFTDINTGWVIEYRSDTSTGSILKTTDGGDNWTSQYSLSNLEFGKVYFTS